MTISIDPTTAADSFVRVFARTQRRGLGPLTGAALLYLSANPAPAETAAVAKALGISHASARSTILSLVELGLVGSKGKPPGAAHPNGSLFFSTRAGAVRALEILRGEG